ncbi:hypothetical protein PVAP13_5KG127607 [Panicum virgatum]|uniref:Uncharacterized protein n=1 Tax=Panicum virgatum TaxID=38727 RepID=A0A8T0SS43_PANVG|nr:hypothetical protein PVAP13_5KG127607 [Panicum virgatum]
MSDLTRLGVKRRACFSASASWFLECKAEN